MRIGCDVDGVLADFNTGFAALLHYLTGRSTINTFSTWTWPEDAGFTAEEISKAWDEVNRSSQWWLSRYPLPGTEEFLRRLAEHDAYFITDRTGSTAKQQTEKWLIRLGVSCPTVLISGAKAILTIGLRLDLFVEDKFQNAEEIGLVARSYLLDRPYNRARPVPHVHRIGSLAEVPV